MKYAVVRFPISDDPKPSTGIGVESLDDKAEVQDAVWTEVWDYISNGVRLPITIEED